MVPLLLPSSAKRVVLIPAGVLHSKARIASNIYTDKPISKNRVRLLSRSAFFDFLVFITLGFKGFPI